MKRLSTVKASSVGDVLEDLVDAGGVQKSVESRPSVELDPKEPAQAGEEKRAVEKARALIDFVMLSRLENEPARILSGGQRKLLELARILMADPQAILLDEPAAGVNPTLLELIIDRVRALNAEGKTILLIEHNMDMVARLCSRVVAMASGRLLAEGAPGEVARDPAVIAAYLGDAA